MKNKNKILYLFLCVVIFNLQNLNVNAVENNKLILSVEHNLEDISFNTTYAISDDFTTWRITSNKAINLSLLCNNNPSNKIILVEHMHCDIFIESEKSVFDDLIQDSMDDYMHGLQGGFFINETFGYNEVFSIEGSSPSFTQNLEKAWRYSDWGSTWWGGEAEFKFSETKLTHTYDVYGQTLYVVYDILIKNLEDDFFHKYVITDNILFTLNGEILDNQGNIYDEDPNDIPGFSIIVLLSCIVSVVYLYKKKINK